MPIMARQILHRIGIVDTEDKPYVALTRYLAADASHAETRVRGGLWADAQDASALAKMRDLALEYATACEERIAKLGSDKAPKPARKPTQAPPAAPAPTPAPAKAAKAAKSDKPAPKPMCDSASHADNASAGAKFCPLCGKDLTVLVREAVVAQARASKPAPAPRVSAPVPTSVKASAELTAEDYERLMS